MPWPKGKPWTPEMRAKMSGGALTPEHRAKISRAVKEARRAPLPITIRACGYATPCWVWTGACSRQGYGAVNRDGKVHRAHRYVYMLLRGVIPDDLPLDHLCMNKLCVNPRHLEPVTKHENELRHARSIPGERERCTKGHLLTLEDRREYVSRSGVIRYSCRICDRAASRRYKEKLKRQGALAAR